MDSAVDVMCGKPHGCWGLAVCVRFDAVGYLVAANRVTGTYFFGGAGMDGDYIPDMVKAMKGAGIAEPFAVDPSKYSRGTLFDAGLGVTLLRDDMDESLKQNFEKTGSYTSHLKSQGSGQGQFNLVGYSYGSQVAAQEASVLTRNGQKIDNLVLIGSPISKEFLGSLRNNPLISKVIVINLTKQGDPLYAGMPHWQIVTNAPTLAKQMIQGGGHFYYAPANAQGAANRRELAKELYKEGLR